MDNTNRVSVRLAQLGTLPKGLEDMPCLKTFTCDGNPFLGADIERSQVRPSFEVGLASIVRLLKRADVLQDLHCGFADLAVIALDRPMSLRVVR